MSEQLAFDMAEVGLDVPQGYKRTEVGVIPEDWEVTSIGSCSELITKGTTPMTIGRSFVLQGITFVKVESVTETGSFDSNKFAYIDVETDRLISRSRIKENDLLISIAGALGRAAIATKEILPANTNQALAIVRLKNSSSLQLNYLYQFTKTRFFKQNIEEISSQGAQPNLSLGDLSRFLVSAPPTEEQAAIATALSDVDALINELKQLLAKKQAIKTATMQQLLTGRTRLPQFALRDDGTPKGYKTSELGEIPEDWNAKKMVELALIQRGASPRPIDSPIWFDSASSVGWLRISDVSKTVKYLTETTQSLSELGIANSRFVPQGNLVMSICATVGKPIITSVNLCIHDGFVVFKGLSVSQDYMYYILKKLEPEWSKQGQTGSQMNLNTELINTTLVLIPQLQEEQAAIATILSEMDSDISNLQQRLSKARQIKQGMMQQLLTGQIRLI